MDTTIRMHQFADLDELLEAYAIDRYPANLKLGVEMGRLAYKYVPHLYRGGYVIPGFGYSTERIGRPIPADRAGNPYLVQ